MLATILSVVLMIIGVLLCVVVLIQSGRAAGLGVISGQSSNPDSYWNKNKNSSVEGSLEKYTKYLGAAFLIVGIVINFVA